MSDHLSVTSEEQPRAGWVAALPFGESTKSSLARLVDEDGGADEAENYYYETAADPQAVQREREQRRYRGAYLRRLRRQKQRPAPPTGE